MILGDADIDYSKARTAVISKVRGDCSEGCHQLNLMVIIGREDAATTAKLKAASYIIQKVYADFRNRSNVLQKRIPDISVDKPDMRVYIYLNLKIINLKTILDSGGIDHERE